MSLSAGQHRAWLREMAAARHQQRRGHLALAFGHLERAHILGQRDTFAHVRAHVAMLRIGRLRGDRREIIGQLLRVIAALTKSRIWVPLGNTGGANVNPFRPMPVPADLKHHLESSSC